MVLDGGSEQFDFGPTEELSEPPEITETGPETLKGVGWVNRIYYSMPADTRLALYLALREQNAFLLAAPILQRAINGFNAHRGKYRSE